MLKIFTVFSILFLLQLTEFGFAMGNTQVNLIARHDENSNQNSTPLCLTASATQDPNTVETFTQSQANIETQNHSNLTPLHWAAFIGNLETVKTLIKARANIEAQNKTGQTPLHLAATTENLEVVKALIHAGANIEAKDHLDYTPLHWAAINGKWSVILILLRRGANKEAQDINGSTPLHLAAIVENVRGAKILIQAGANIDAQNKHQLTPLHLAIFNSQLNVIELLLTSSPKLIDHQTQARMHMIVRGQRIDLPAKSNVLDFTKIIVPHSEKKQKMIELLESFEFLFAFQNRDTDKLIDHAVDKKK